MDLKIVTKFTVASEAGLRALLYLTEEISREKFSKQVPEKILEKYISQHFNEKKLTDDLNDILSQQWLVVYANEQPAGYARMSSNGRKLPGTADKKVIRIIEFGILNKYNDPLIWSSLYDKCNVILNFYDVVWLNEYVGSPLIKYLEKRGFVKSKDSCEAPELLLPSVCLAKMKSY